MKVILVQNHPHGILRLRWELIQSILKKGHEVHVLIPDWPESKALSHKMESEGTKCHYFPLDRTGLNPVRDIPTILSLRKHFKTLRPDVVIAATVKPVIYASLAAWLSGVKIKVASLITGGGYVFRRAEASKSPLTFLVKRLFRFALRKNDMVIFQNEDDRKFFFEHSLIGSSMPTLVVNGSGVDLRKFAFTPIKDKEALSFIFVGRFIGLKGFDVYLKAAKILKEKYPELNFRALGRFDSSPTALKEADVQEYKQAVEFIDDQDDVRPFIQEADVFVLPSYGEGTSRACIEALAIGRPIVSTQSPGCKNTVIEGENGWTVPPGDPEALAKTLERFVKEPEMCKKMAPVSRQHAEKFFDVEEVNSQIMRVVGL